MSFREIAEIVEANENTVKYRYYTGLEKIKNLIKNYDEKKRHIGLVLAGVGMLATDQSILPSPIFILTFIQNLMPAGTSNTAPVASSTTGMNLGTMIAIILAIAVPAFAGGYGVSTLSSGFNTNNSSSSSESSVTTSTASTSESMSSESSAASTDSTSSLSSTSAREYDYESENYPVKFNYPITMEGWGSASASFEKDNDCTRERINFSRGNSIVIFRDPCNGEDTFVQVIDTYKIKAETGQTFNVTLGGRTSNSPTPDFEATYIEERYYDSSLKITIYGVIGGDADQPEILKKQLKELISSMVINT